MPTVFFRSVLGAALLGGSGCGGSGGAGPGGGGDNPSLTKAAVSGDGQAAPLGTALPNPLRVLITQGGNPVPGRTVSWSVSPEGGSANPAGSVTDASGIASSSITLPPLGTTVTISASASNVSGSPVQFTADATGAGTMVEVKVGNTFFLPESFRIKQSGLVTFTWQGGASDHNVFPVPPNTIPASVNPAPPATHSAPYGFDVTFPATGTFKYYCQTHGAPDSGMHGTISVIP